MSNWKWEATTNYHRIIYPSDSHCRTAIKIGIVLQKLQLRVQV